jgi:hypothetical protein
MPSPEGLLQSSSVVERSAVKEKRAFLTVSDMISAVVLPKLPSTQFTPPVSDSVSERIEIAFYRGGSFFAWRWRADRSRTVTRFALYQTR